jgi:hypothetical protein
MESNHDLPIKSCSIMTTEPRLQTCCSEFVSIFINVEHGVATAAGARRGHSLALARASRRPGGGQLETYHNQLEIWPCVATVMATVLATRLKRGVRRLPVAKTHEAQRAPAWSLSCVRSHEYYYCWMKIIRVLNRKFSRRITGNHDP